MLLDEVFTPTDKLTKDVKAAAKLMTRDLARYLVDRYYQVQRDRIRAESQARTAAEGGEPNELLEWNAKQVRSLEANIRATLNAYSLAQPPGVWAQSVYGCGPVISAGFLSHIDIEQAPTVGHIWRFAGLDPTAIWEKGGKRPWNADLKVLCWKLGESFVKFHANPKCVYGHVYLKRKTLETERNEAGMFRELAEKALSEKKWRDSDTKTCYQNGKLPPGRIHARARRYAVKLFLSHLHHVMFEDRYKTAPPKPYVFAFKGHDEREYVGPIGWPLPE